MNGARRKLKEVDRGRYGAASATRGPARLAAVPMLSPRLVRVVTIAIGFLTALRLLLIP